MAKFGPTTPKTPKGPKTPGMGAPTSGGIAPMKAVKASNAVKPALAGITVNRIENAARKPVRTKVPRV